MAVTVLQAPTTPNVTGTNLVYTLSSSLATSPQYRYVTDIYESGTDNYITTIKTYPNIHGTGIVDVARELDDQLGYDKNWKAIEYLPEESVKTFDLRFGEQYGTSISSSITTYPGTLNYELQVIPGHLGSSNEGYNFNTASIANRNKILSNAPEALIDPNEEDFLFVNYTDYHTVTILGGTAFFLQVYVYRNETPLSLIQYYTDPFNTVGIGPQNILDAGGTSVPTMYSATHIEIVNNGVPLYTITLPQHPAYPCSDEYTRFAFINQYGFWDYYNVYNPLRRNTEVDRLTYERPRVRYEDEVAYFNGTDRGNTQYMINYEDVFEITTDYISQETSQWITELFESPEVYIQSGSDFIPITIVNTNFTTNLNTSRNKLFQYTIQFKYANKRLSR